MAPFVVHGGTGAADRSMEAAAGRGLELGVGSTQGVDARVFLEGEQERRAGRNQFRAARCRRPPE
jgi:hypothetical protein